MSMLITTTTSMPIAMIAITMVTMMMAVRQQRAAPGGATAKA